jgi:hypothetical protein
MRILLVTLSFLIVLRCGAEDHKKANLLPLAEEVKIGQLEKMLFQQFADLQPTVSDMTLGQLEEKIRAITPFEIWAGGASGNHEYFDHALSRQEKGHFFYCIRIATVERTKDDEDYRSLKVVGYALRVFAPDGTAFENNIVPMDFPFFVNDPKVEKTDRKKEANQALVPTATSVTPAAGAPVAPAAAAAHL